MVIIYFLDCLTATTQTECFTNHASMKTSQIVTLWQPFVRQWDCAREIFCAEFLFSEPLERICRIVGTLIETVTHFPTTFATYTQVRKSYCSGNGNICSTLYHIVCIYVRFGEICIVVFSKFLLKYIAFAIRLLSVFNLYVKSHDIIPFWSEKIEQTRIPGQILSPIWRAFNFNTRIGKNP